MLREFVAKQLEEYNLTMMEWVLLALVHERGSTGVSPSDLSARLDVSQPMVTRMVKAVIEDGYAERRIDQKDKRQHVIVATKSGQWLAQRIEQRVRSAMREWMADVDKDDLKGYINIMVWLGEH